MLGCRWLLLLLSLLRDSLRERLLISASPFSGTKTGGTILPLIRLEGQSHEKHDSERR